MRSEISNIRVVCKGGAFGRTDATGIWIYGKRGDGRTVACKNEIQPDGSIQIWSDRFTTGPFIETDMTEYSRDEWDRIKAAPASDKTKTANQILKSRT